MNERMKRIMGGAGFPLQLNLSSCEKARIISLDEKTLKLFISGHS